MTMSLKESKQRIRDAALVSNIDNLMVSSLSAPLFHYTNANGLFGILEKHVLWATDYRFLNDKSEYIFGQGIVTEALRAKKDGFRDPIVDVWTNVKENLKDLPIFVASLCEDGDLLSQWRGYSRLHDGYAVAFSATNLTRKAPFRLMQAVYSRRKQHDLLNRILETSRTVHSEVDPSDRKEIVHETLVALLRLICSFKDESFQGEKEWRLVSLGSHSETKFRVISGHIAPYVEIRLKGPTLTILFKARVIFVRQMRRP